MATLPASSARTDARPAGHLGGEHLLGQAGLRARASVSPTHMMGSSPWSSAARTFLATVSSVSPK